MFLQISMQLVLHEEASQGLRVIRGAGAQSESLSGWLSFAAFPVCVILDGFSRLWSAAKAGLTGNSEVGTLTSQCWLRAWPPALGFLPASGAGWMRQRGG